jgi:hypothetical protein
MVSSIETGQTQSDVNPSIKRDIHGLDVRFSLLDGLIGNGFSKYVVCKARLALQRSDKVDSLEDLQKLCETGEFSRHFQTGGCSSFQIGKQTRECLWDFVQRFNELSTTNK